MRITDVQTTLLTGPATEDPFLSQSRHVRSTAFIEILTDTELVGVGETYAGYFIAEAVPVIAEFFKPILVGQTVADVPELWRRMYRCANYWCRSGLALAVINGIEAALWDLRGKALKTPVCQLIGGVRHERLPCYATGGPSNYPKDQLRRKMNFYLAQGFRGFKLGAGAHTSSGGWSTPTEPRAIADFEADKFEFVRSAVGPDVWVMLDAHMGNTPLGICWPLETALLVAEALTPYKLAFIEEPLPYVTPRDYAMLCESTCTPIAGGECLTGPDWDTFIEHKSFDIGQPDASFTGGMMDFLRVADLLEASGRKVATHAWGAGASLMQNIHCGFAAANTVILEIPAAYGPLHRELIGDSFVMRDGYVYPPQTPGLGITLTGETKRRFPFVPGSGEFMSVPGKIMAEELLASRR